MPRINILAGALALALGGATAAQAQQFSSVITIGDSLSDAGNVAAVQHLPPGNSFTTNPDPVAAQVIASAFGFNQTNSLAGGSNFAFGGACVRANGPTFTCGLSPGSFSLTTQLTGYLAANGGHADGHALYTMWGGANDIFTAAANPATAQVNTGISAGTMVGLIGTLQAAGAKTIVAFNLPDIGQAPQFRGTASAASVTGLVTVYNGVFNDGLATFGDGIVPINTFALLNEVIGNPGLYGFTNVTGIACGPGAPGVVTSVACGPAGSGLPFTYAAGTNQTFLFADGVHPTGGTHAMLASVVVNTLQAPGQISLAGEVPLQVYEDHSAVINNQIFQMRGTDRAEGDTRGFANIQFGDQDYDASINTQALSSNLFTASFGFDYRYSERFDFGAAISLGVSNGDSNLGSIDGREALASVYGVLKFGHGGYLNAILSGGSNTLDIDRNIQLGATTRKETGNTSASHTGAELGGGYVFGAGSVKHGPFASVTYQRINVGGYAEDALDSTAMNFDGFERQSLIGRFGYQIEGQFDMGGRSVQPYGRVAYADEDRDNITSVRAGSNTMNGHFVLPGFIPTKNWVEADLGVNVVVNDSTQVSVSYRGHLSDDTQDRNSLNLGFRMSF